MLKPIYHSIFDPLINQASAEFKKKARRAPPPAVLPLRAWETSAGGE